MDINGRFQVEGFRGRMCSLQLSESRSLHGVESEYAIQKGLENDANGIHVGLEALLLVELKVWKESCLLNEPLSLSSPSLVCRRGRYPMREPVLVGLIVLVESCVAEVTLVIVVAVAKSCVPWWSMSTSDFVVQSKVPSRGRSRSRILRPMSVAGCRCRWMLNSGCP